MSKPFRHYRVLEAQLRVHVEPDTCAALLAGMETVEEGAAPATKAEWACAMMERMDRLLDADTCLRVREGCACVRSSAHSIYARTFRKLRQRYPEDQAYLREVVAYLNSTQPLRRCGEVTHQGDALYSVIARGTCGCSVVREGLPHPISKTWCQCCQGSLRSVYEHVFTDRRCEMDILGTIATGAEECCFVTRYR